MTSAQPAHSPGLRVQTGTKGLDDLLDGGLTPNRMYLIQGLPGTGKTTLGLRYLMEGRERGERTLYVTLSETTDELFGVAESHGWSLDGVDLFQLPAAEIQADQQYTLYHPAEIELGETVKGVLEAVERIRPRRVVFDSLSELRLLAREPLRYRRQILALKEYFAGREMTVLLLDDQTGGPDGDQQIESLAHGVLLLEQLPFEYGRARRRVRVVKFRGVAAMEGFHDFIIRRGGIVVFPQIITRPSDSSRTIVAPLTSGVLELDQLVGGGLTWGSSTLLIGPPGTGKSTLAAQYIHAEGTRSAVFLFDERRASFISRADALGMRVSERIEAGTVEVHQVEPGELSPGEFSYRVRDAVEQRGVRIVLIDSVNGYINAIPQVETPLVRLHELLSYLNCAGVATLITVAQQGLLGMQMAAPIDISYLADCVILLRFFEASGAVRRAISVVKKRTGLHEATIRELQIGAGGIRVGEALSDFHGVLTGVPQYTGPGGPLLNHGKR